MLQRQSSSDLGRWVSTPVQQFFLHPPEVAASTDLASMLAEGVSQSLEVSDYPTASLYLFIFNPRKTIDRNLYVYNVGVRHFEFGKAWGFYLRSPICSVRVFDTPYETDKQKGIY